MKKYFYTGSVIILIGLGIYLGYLFFAPKKSTPAISSSGIVSMLRQEGFLVTQTYIVNEQVKINNDTGNIFRDFFLGQEITAFGTMKISSGVDLEKIKESDILVTPGQISVKLPPIEVHGVELIGDLTLQNRQGILKKIFNYDDGYNTAYDALRTEALASAATSTIVLDAENSTRDEIARLIKLASPNVSVTISF